MLLGGCNYSFNVGWTGKLWSSKVRKFKFFNKKSTKVNFDFRITCDAERCKTCEDAFTAGEVDVASFRCADECEKCKLCEGQSIPECKKWCRAGAPGCRAICYKGIAVCGLCSLLGQCNLLYPYGKKK